MCERRAADWGEAADCARGEQSDPRPARSAAAREKVGLGEMGAVAVLPRWTRMARASTVELVGVLLRHREAPGDPVRYVQNSNRPTAPERRPLRLDQASTFSRNVSRTFSTFGRAFIRQYASVGFFSK